MPKAQIHFPVARRRAFTLIEILIVVVILGILAAVVIPQFSGASTLARENVLKDELRYMRTQILVYKAQHHDQAPTDLEAQLTAATDADGQPGTEYGPYLTKMPTNPVNGKSDVRYVTGAMTPDGTTGWMYNASTQEFLANLVGNDSNNVPFINY